MKSNTYKTTISKIDRRTFLKTGSLGATGLLLGFHVGCMGPGDDFTDRPTALFEPNVYVSLNQLGEVTIIAHRSEMGQGARTSLPSILADEMEADWDKVKIQQSVGDEEIYGNQNTDGSFTIRMFYIPMRKAGATARLMLEQAAASIWKVDVSECKAQNHFVVHQKSGDKLDFGALAEEASKLPVPSDDELKLKNENEFKLIGKNVPIVDMANILTGKAVYGMDYEIPGMKYAVIARCPVVGGKVISYDDSKTMAVSGVERVIQMDTPNFPSGFEQPLGGVAVIASNTWSAWKGRDALGIEWNLGEFADYDSEVYEKEMLKSVQSKGTIRRADGNVKDAFAKANKKLKSVYTLSHQAHAPMETPNAVADYKEGKCTVWAPSQHPQWSRNAVANALGLDSEQVEMNVTLLGGGFGRKSKQDFIVEAAKLSKINGCPIKVVWTREDDLHHDFLHCCSAQAIEVAIDDDNQVSGWKHSSVFPSIAGTGNKEQLQPGPVERCMGLTDFPYDIPNIKCQTTDIQNKIRIGWMRSVANVQHAFAIGSMMDEIATARGMDAADNLIDLLGPDREIPFDELVEDFFNYNEKVADYPCKTGRLRNVIEEVKKKANWGKALPKGSGQGIYAHRSFLTYVACVVEVKMVDGKITIPEVHYVVDCGKVISPERSRAQFEGGAIFALTGALSGKITFKKGVMQQDNFDGYQLTRMKNAPSDIHVHFIENDEKPTGVGEPPVPPVAPALCNAIFAATGKRVRKLPIEMS
ncbi:MAG: molybdopterin-dependent oxidoreductase [Reichenbachiella sp.]